ncbi:hypothetical protein BOS5A_211330 [Bosea sp. EC-HK365B]|nr:hypothetical protein BOSE21B_50361 [Bosea sp. 21B]CAD5301222.1 hypothetical protein BOSE7B_90330 [Bosea sp. 7B]VVT60539.1 hypothetical protein BOS5A_211330 [Bosea sp. EC-HK365B]VXB65487.1 hypothetical protein BOSE127_140271 [Bosea sp. 127]
MFVSAPFRLGFSRRHKGHSFNEPNRFKGPGRHHHRRGAGDRPGRCRTSRRQRRQGRDLGSRRQARQ